MKNLIKLLSVSLIVIFGISLCTVEILATNTPNETVAPPESSVITPSSESTIAPVVTEPTYVETVPTEPATTPTVATTQPTTKPTKPSYTTKPTTQATTASIAMTTSVQYYTSATSSYTQQYTTESTEPSVLETSDERIDDKHLKKKDWEDIKNKLLNNDDTDGDSDDFKWIHENSDRDDNGLWMLISGIGLIVVGAGIIIFWIVFTVKKKNSKGTRNGKGNRGSKPYPPTSAGSRNPHRSGDNYNDSYNSQPPSSRERRQINKRSKYDTGEVTIPRSRRSSDRTRSNSRYRH